MTDLFDTTLARIRPVDQSAIAAATERQDQLTKVPGSLGQLEVVGIRLAGIAGQCPPPVPQQAVVGVFAGDHGVHAQGVSPWPQEITVGMLVNMAQGGAAINVLSRQMGVRTVLTDVGVAGDYPDSPAIRRRRVRPGTADFSVEAAMTRDEALQALVVGIETGLETIEQGADCLMTGEMGIGNTSPASTLIAVTTGSEVAEVTGRGAGSDDEMLARKTQVLQRALDLHQPSADDPVGLLAAVGGLEHAALTGFILAGAAAGVPVVLDGVIACSAACVAVALNPEVKGYLVAGHAGVEPGIRRALEHLGLTALVDLDLRLGEGTGAVLAWPMVQASARILSEMATFAEAGLG